MKYLVILIFAGIVFQNISAEGISLAAKPVFTSKEKSRVSLDSMYYYQFAAIDSMGNLLTFAAINLPAWLTFDEADHSVSGRAVKPGQFPIHLSVSNGKETVFQQFMLTVYDHQTTNILAIGNSITNGTDTFNSYRRALWQLLHDQHYNFDFIGSWSRHHMGGDVPNPDFDLDHEGHSGWTLANLFSQPGWDSSRGNINIWLKEYTPDIVLFELGTNDVFQCRPIGDMMKEFSRALKLLRGKNSTVKVFLAQIPPLGAQWANKNLCGNGIYSDLIKKLNKAIAEFAATHSTTVSPVIIVDQFSGINPAIHMYDDIHPNKAGEKIMADRWFTAIRKHLKKLTQPASFEQLIQSFKQPGNKYGSAPLWVWNADVDTTMIRDALKEFSENSFGGVFIHPRAGLITPYLSGRWMELYAYAVQEAKKYNLDVWIYDENSYPSGFAGGHVPAVMPESFNQGQMLQLEKTTLLPTDAETYFICLKKQGDLFIDITGNVQLQKGQAGDFYLFKKTYYYQSPWYAGFSYVDLMVKGVTEKFIEQTMTGYEKVLGKELGKTIPGIFSDEPNIEVQYDNNIRWTPDLFGAFQQKWGYDLSANLPSLFEKTGDWKRVRHNYYETLLNLFIDRWSKPFYNYAQKKNLEWTGHYWEHEWPSPYHVPDNMAMYAWHQRPGIDMLFNQFDEESVSAQFGNVRSVKELASVANQLNKKRTLSETYGGGGWELTLKDMKRLGDWQFVLGVNTLNQHLSYMTIMGARKYDYPQSFSYHEPWWPYYKNLNQYFARLSFALSSGSQKNKILIIEPTTTAWMYYNRDKPDTIFNQIGNNFQRFITRLEKSQVEYDLGCENIIRDHGEITNARFAIGAAEYETVIIPPGMENINSETFVLLKKFASAGGKILEFSTLKTIDGRTDNRLESFNSNNYIGLTLFKALDNNVIRRYFTGKDFSIIIDPSSKGDLYHHRRIVQDGEILFLCNSSMANEAKFTIQANGAELLHMNLFTGEISSYPAQINNNKIRAAFTIPSAGSELFFIAAKKQPGLLKHINNRKVGKVIPSGTTTVKRLTDNALAIDFCDIAFGKTQLKDQHVYNATDTLFKHNGFAEGNPWNTSVQFENNTIKKDTFSRGTGFSVTYHFNIIGKIEVQLMKAVVERPNLWHVLINDHEVLPNENGWWLDKAFKVFSIGAWLKQGQNKLTLVADRMSVHAEIEPVYILGNFALSAARKGWNIIPATPLSTGSWKKQGLNMYAFQVGYTKNVSLKKTVGKQYILRLGKWAGTVCAVDVNGKPAGTIAYPPYELDITSALKNGNNIIEVKATGSLKNLLGPFHSKNKPGMVSPWHFRYVDHYPSGNDYDLYDYGIMEDYILLEK